MSRPILNRLFVSCLVLSALTACPQEKAQESPPPSPPAESLQAQTGEAHTPAHDAEAVPPELAQSRAATKALLGELQSTLKAALKSGGPTQGIQVCQSAASPLTQGVAEKSNLEIRRVSTQTRNPENAPDDFELKVLSQLKQLHEEGKLNADTEHHETVTQDGKKVFRYLKPILIQEACLKCHGQEIQADVQALLDQHYPQDKATGYKLGDLRGAVSIKIPL